MPCRWTLSGGHAIGQVSSNILPMPRFLYVDPSRLFPVATPTAPAQHLGPASQAYCVLPWLMMTSGKLGEDYDLYVSISTSSHHAACCATALLDEVG